MPYWGSGSCDGDYAFTLTGSCALRVKKKLLKESEVAARTGKQEQLVLGLLSCFRAILEQFWSVRALLAYSLEVDELEERFDSWFQRARKSLSPAVRHQVRADADAEFRAFRKLQKDKRRVNSTNRLSTLGRKRSGSVSTSLGVKWCVQLLRELLFENGKLVIARGFGEQGIVALVCCLRAIDAHSSGSARAVFGARELDQAEDLFYEWHEIAGRKIPKKFRLAVLTNAEKEFSEYRRQLNGGRAGPARVRPKTLSPKSKAPSAPLSSKRKGRLPTFRLIETTPDQFSLLLNTGGLTLDHVAEEFGHEANGYFWEGIAETVVMTKARRLAGRFDYDCESSMFCARGSDRQALTELQKLMADVMTNEGLLRAFLKKAEKLGVELGG